MGLARKGDIAFRTANFASSSREARELLENLYAARKKPVRTAIGGQVWILKAGITTASAKMHFGCALIRRQSSIVQSCRPSRRNRGSIWHSFTTTRRSTAGHPRNRTSSGTFTTPPSVHQRRGIRGLVRARPHRALGRYRGDAANPSIGRSPPGAATSRRDFCAFQALDRRGREMRDALRVAPYPSHDKA